jgi:hypothetical protein
MVMYGHRSVVAPLSADTFKIQFAATRTCRDKLRRAQDLMRHRIPDGDLGTIFEKASCNEHACPRRPSGTFGVGCLDEADRNGTGAPPRGVDTAE